MTPSDAADRPGLSPRGSPRLVLLNGLPGSGKSTLARRFVQDHPLALCLDLDLVRDLLGSWSEEPDEAGQTARRLALGMARVCLAGGRDVVVPQFLGRTEFIDQLERLANREGARFIEVALLNEPADAVARLARRAAGPLTPTQRDAHLQLDQQGGLAALPEMQAGLDQVLAHRPRTTVLVPQDGQIDQTYRELLAHIAGRDFSLGHPRPARPPEATTGSSFDDGVEPWLRGLGRLRDLVRQHLVATQLREAMAGHPPGRVLDVGCLQGTQALAMARDGHHVTGLDPSDELLARFRAALDAEPAPVRSRVHRVRGVGEDAPVLTPGPFDVVLCHGVLMYLDDITPLLDALTAVATGTARLSLLVRNGLAPAMRDGLRGHTREALGAFDRADYTNRLGLPARAHTPDDLDRVLGPLGWQRDRWYGVRVFCDHRDEDAPEPGVLEPLLAAEREAGRRDPYRQVAALLHLFYDRHPSLQDG